MISTEHIEATKWDMELILGALKILDSILYNALKILTSYSIRVADFWHICHTLKNSPSACYPQMFP